MSSGSSWPTSQAAVAPTMTAVTVAPIACRTTPAAELAGRGAQRLEGGEQLALLQDDQGEEEGHDQAAPPRGWRR